MEVHLAEDQIAQLNDLAVGTGRGTDELVREAIARMLEYDSCLFGALEDGLVSARRGELLEHEQMFRS